MAKRGRGNSNNGTIKGNKRDNDLKGTDGADLIQGLAGNDILTGLAGNDSLYGDNGNDWLIGGGGADLLQGGADDDILDAGLGDDVVDGGTGTDRAIFSGPRDAYVVSQPDVTTIQIVGPEGTDTFTNVEVFEFSDMTQSVEEVVLPRIANLALSTATYNVNTDADLNEGATVAMTLEVSNSGDVDATDFQVVTVLSRDDVLSPDDVTIGTFTGDLAAGQDGSFMVDYAIDESLPAGRYELISYIDWTPLAGETDQTDNIATGYIPINFIGGTTFGTSGNDYFHAARVDGSFDLGSGNDTVVVSGGQIEIDGGAGMDTVSFWGRREDFDVTQMGAETIVVVGENGTTTVTGAEVFEFYDVTQSAAEVILAPELDVSAGPVFVADATIGPDQQTLINWSVTQEGVVASGENFANLVIATAPDMGSVIDVLDSGYSNLQTQGNSQNFTAVLDATSLAPGSYFVAAVADRDGTLAESDEVNNLSDWVEITVEEPFINMTLDSVVIEPTSEFDFSGVATADITVTMTNNGNVDIDNRVLAQLFISEDDVGSFGREDDWLGGAMTEGVAVGETVTVSVSRKIDEALLDGTYNLVARIQISQQTDGDTSDDQIVLSDAITLTRDVINGTTDDDVVQGTARAETIRLDAGDDVYLGSEGSDVVYGGTGFDVADYSAHGTAIEVGTNNYSIIDGGISVVPSDYASYAGHNELSTISGFEKIIGTAFDDFFLTSSNPYNPNANLSEVDGGAGNDVIQAGGAGADTLFGGTGDDVLMVFGGDDVMTGGDGRDSFVFIANESLVDPYSLSLQSTQVITDFDPSQDILLFETDPYSGTAFDPFASMTQTTEGVRIDYRSDSAVIVADSMIDELTTQNVNPEYMVFF